MRFYDKVPIFFVQHRLKKFKINNKHYTIFVKNYELVQYIYIYAYFDIFLFLPTKLAIYMTHTTITIINTTDIISATAAITVMSG